MELLQSHAPLYYQLKTFIKNKIELGEWEVGTAIPSERELEKSLGLSRTPVRQAIGELVVEGILEKKHGKGTFVAEPTNTQTTTTLVGLLEGLKHKNLQPTVKIHEYKIRVAPIEVTSKLHLPEGSQMIMVRRQISVDHRCLIVDENYFNLNLTAFITEDNLSNNTVFELLEKNGIHIRKGSQIFSSSLLNGLNAELLNLSEGSPALVIKTLLFNARELPLQYSISYCNPDTYEHEILLSR